MQHLFRLLQYSETMSSSMKAYSPVAQEHSMGCAVACVASRCGLAYRNAHDFFAQKSNAWTRGYYCNEVIEALARAGFQYSFEEYRAQKHVALLSSAGTIVFIHPTARYPSGHFLLRVEDGWMNPWANFPWMNGVEAECQVELMGKPFYILFEIN